MSGIGGTWEGLGGPVRVQRPHLGGIDPALEDCCQREIESNRRRNVLESALNRHDVTLKAERRRRHLISDLSWGDGCRCCYDPNSDGGEYPALMELREELKKKKEDEEEHGEQEEEDDDNNSEDSSDDEFDYLIDDDIGGGETENNDPGLAELEERRRAELEFAFLTQQTALQHGYGAHRQLHSGRVLKAAGLGRHLAGSHVQSAPPAVVLHLFDPESRASATLDLYLEQLALESFRGTVFLRSEGRSTLFMDVDRLASKAFPRLSPNEDMPVLVAIRDGVIKSMAPKLRGLVDDRDEEGTVVEGAVRDWLDKAGVLVEALPDFYQICRVRPEEEALLDNMAREKKLMEAEERYDCGIATCNKTFPHQHVGIQTAKQDGLVVQKEDVVAKTATASTD